MSAIILRLIWKPLALLVASVVLFWRGRKAGQRAAAGDAGAAYIDTRKRMDDVEDDIGALPDDARRWLQSRDPLRR